MTDTTNPAPDPEQWRVVDEGWGRQAAEFAALMEPSNCREYVALQHALGVDAGLHLLDIACGAGLAIELAEVRGARCAGIDASPRLVAVARDRNPGADVRVGDMNALPWEEASFDVVTSFRGIWGTTPQVLDEACRVLVPGGRIGLTVWGHIKASPGAWALAPFVLAAEPKVQNQAAMVALGRPGAGEALLAESGFIDVERVDIPFVFEFADPESYARALATTGPAYEAIQTVGEEAFHDAAVEFAGQHVRDGLPLRAHVAVVGYLGTKPDHRRPILQRVVSSRSIAASFLTEPPPDDEIQRLFDADLEGSGYVTNLSRLWAQLPAALHGLSDLLREVTIAASLTDRQRAVLVTAAASALGDSYCSLAWGKRLAEAASPETAASVIRDDDDEGLDDGERALARWARLVTRDPNAATPGHVQELRDAGFTDSQIFAITTFVSLRLAFATVNDSLGALPDPELRASVPDPVGEAVRFGRPVGNGE